MVVILSVTGLGLYDQLSSESPLPKQTLNHVLSFDTKTVFEPVLPDVPVVFPKDYMFHNEFQYESWEYFANLIGNDGKHYSVQWNYYRTARDDAQLRGWNSTQLYLSHAAIISKQGIWKQQRIARGGIGQAGLKERPFRLWIDNWNWRSTSLSPLPGVLSISTDDFLIQLHSSSVTSFLPIGNHGYQSQHDLLPLATYGFDAPFIQVSGQLMLQGTSVLVSGEAWLKKEWGSELEALEGQKKIVINLHLADGRNLQLNQNRISHYPNYTYGAVTNRDGSRTILTDEDITMTAVEYSSMSNGKLVPLKWKIKITKLDLELTTAPLRNDLWHDFYNPYWQGPVLATGTQEAQGMLKLTGF